MAIQATNMAKRLAIGLITLIGLSSGWVASSEAAPMTYRFAGAITQTYFAPGDPYQGDIHVGTPFSGSFTFDSVGHPPQQTGEVWHTWHGLPYQMRVSMGGHSFSTSIQVSAVVSTGFAAHDDFSADGCVNGPCHGLRIGFDLLDSDGTVFSDTGVPLNLPFLFDEFEARWFRMTGFFDGLSAMYGELTSLTCANGVVNGATCAPDPDPAPPTVPEPGTLLLLASGLAFLARRRQSSVRIRPSSPTSQWTSANATR